LLDERSATPALKSSVAELFERYSASRRELEGAEKRGGKSRRATRLAALINCAN